jgi:hypothetical protein
MQLIFSRTIPYLEAASAEARVIFLELRGALIRLNEPPQDRGAFWT